jgi:hypothetical protein
MRQAVQKYSKHEWILFRRRIPETSLNAVNRLGANSDSIQPNDVRLKSMEGCHRGTKELNFDPDLNKLVALPVLDSFPRKSDDYASIRVYDANGNGFV